MRIGFMLFSLERAKKMNRNFLWIGQRLEKIFYNVKYELSKTELGIDCERYLTANFFSSLAYGVIGFFFSLGLFFLRFQILEPTTYILSGLISLGFFLVFFMINLWYPRLIANRYANEIDRSLIFALKSMLVQAKSGISLFDSMKNISKAKYGLISTEFGKLVKEISSGKDEVKALEKFALRTKSEYLKKTIWQIISSLRSGASLEGALKNVVQLLTNNQVREIKNYSAELNMWLLVYLLLATALPALGITFLVVLSTMGGSSIEAIHLFFLAIGAVIMQSILIGFVKTRVPKVYI